MAVIDKSDWANMDPKIALLTFSEITFNNQTQSALLLMESSCFSSKVFEKGAKRCIMFVCMENLYLFKTRASGTIYYGNLSSKLVKTWALSVSLKNKYVRFFSILVFPR